MASGKPLTDADFKPLTDADFQTSGSVFAHPTVGQRLKQIGKAVGPSAAAMSTAMAGGETGAAVGSTFGPVGTVVGSVAGAAIGGAAAPFVQRQGEAAVSGQPYQPPTSKEVIKSAVLNAGLTGLGEAGAKATRWASTEDEVRAELGKLPKAQQTVGNIKKIRQAIADRATGQAAEAAKISDQDLRNRDFWKAHGLNDKQIDAVLKQPDLQQQLARSIEQADRVKGAFQATIDTGRESFKQRYDAILPKEAKVDMAGIGAQMEALASGSTQHELSPGFRAYLQRKGLEFTKAGETTGPSVGGVPWKQLPDSLKKKIQEQGAAQGIQTPTSELSIPQVRDFRTELREQLPASATNLDRQVAKQLNDQITQAYEAHLTPEQKGALGALDQEYGRFQEMIKSLDPRSEKFGQQVVKALFDPMTKDTGAAMNFIRLAQEADKATPGVMENVRGAFMDKALKEARAPGQPMDELKALRKLQDTWSGDKETRAVMGAMFGKDSPLANPATFTHVVEAASDSQALSLKVQQSGGHNILKSPYFQGVITYGAWAAILGASTKGGIFGAITGSQGPEKQAMAITAMLAGPPMINWIARSGNGPAQRAMVGFLTNPGSDTAVKYAGEITGALTGALSTSSQGDTK